MVIAIFNNKGGVGKTTIAVGLAAALASPRRRVLLVDLANEAAASVWCGIPRQQLRPSAASCLIDAYPALSAVRPTGIPHLDIIPGSTELANVDVALASRRGREHALRRMLDRLEPHYDLILVDTPPGLSLLSVNVIVAADALIVPVTPEPLPLVTLAGTMAMLERVRARMAARAQLMGIVITMLDPQRKHARDLADELRSEYRDTTFHTEIRWSATIAASAVNGPAAAAKTASADAFRRLAGEVLHRLPHIRQ